MTDILLTGDVMLGRGIDQILQRPLAPEIYEPFCKSALDYVALAERKNGPIPRGVACDYVWGDALPDMLAADLRIINLETAITCCDIPAPKGINYRCHPANVGCLAAARIDCCVLANNHVLDWGEDGLIETLVALNAAGVGYCGAGRDIEQAADPVLFALPDGGRLLVYALGSPSSGVPRSWAAGESRPGVNLLDNHDLALERLTNSIRRDRNDGDTVMVSIHWGGNWSYDVPGEQRDFAHGLIDDAGVDIVHGHSSHHPRAIELYRDRPILYGCGDFLNDYEGIGGQESYRPDLVVAYRLILHAGRPRAEVELLPFRISKFRLNHASPEEMDWLTTVMNREYRRFGGVVAPDGSRLRATAAAVH